MPLFNILFVYVDSLTIDIELTSLLTVLPCFLLSVAGRKGPHHRQPEAPEQGAQAGGRRVQEGGHGSQGRARCHQEAGRPKIHNTLQTSVAMNTKDNRAFLWAHGLSPLTSVLSSSLSCV
jgi:hypothetical protein